MTKEEADAAVAAAKERVIEAARTLAKHRIVNVGMPGIIYAMDELVAAETAREALDRPRLISPEDRGLASVCGVIVEPAYSQAKTAAIRAVRHDRDHILAEAEKLPAASARDILDMKKMDHPSGKWLLDEPLISRADLRRLIRGEG